MKDLERMEPGPKPKVVVMLQDAKDPEEPKPPAGWKLVDNVPRDQDMWWAFVLEAR